MCHASTSPQAITSGEVLALFLICGVQQDLSLQTGRVQQLFELACGGCPFFIFIFSQRHVVLHYENADCEHRKLPHQAVFCSESLVQLRGQHAFAQQNSA